MNRKSVSFDENILRQFKKSKKEENNFNQIDKFYDPSFPLMNFCLSDMISNQLVPACFPPENNDYGNLIIPPDLSSFYQYDFPVVDGANPAFDGGNQPPFKFPDSLCDLWKYFIFLFFC